MFRICPLFLNNFRAVGIINYIVGKCFCIAKRACHRVIVRFFRRTHNTHYFKLKGGIRQFFQLIHIVAYVFIPTEFIFNIGVTGGYHIKLFIAYIFKAPLLLLCSYLFTGLDFIHNFFIFRWGQHAKLIKGRRRNFVIFVYYENNLVVCGRPISVNYIIAFFYRRAYKLSVLSRKHFFKIAVNKFRGHLWHCAHIFCHWIFGIFKRTAVGVYKLSFRIKGIYSEFCVIGINYSVFADILVNVTFGIIKILFKFSQVIFGKACGHCRSHFNIPRVRIYSVQAVRSGTLIIFRIVSSHWNHWGKVKSLGVNSNWIGHHCFFLNIGYIVINARWKRKDKSYSYYTNGACKRRKQSSCLFCA